MQSIIVFDVSLSSKEHQDKIEEGEYNIVLFAIAIRYSNYDENEEDRLLGTLEQ